MTAEEANKIFDEAYLRDEKGVYQMDHKELNAVFDKIKDAASRGISFAIVEHIHKSVIALLKDRGYRVFFDHSFFYEDRYVVSFGKEIFRGLKKYKEL